MSNTTIRSATGADASIVAVFNVAMALETEGKTLSEHIITAGVTKLMTNPDLGFFLVAETDGQIAGCLGITFEWSDWRNGLFWWIQSVYVHPDFRRHGVFRRLYEHVTNLAHRDDSVCGVRLYVEKENATAQQTYRKLGMTETDYRLFEIEFEHS